MSPSPDLDDRPTSGDKPGPARWIALAAAVVVAAGVVAWLLLRSPEPPPPPPMQPVVREEPKAPEPALPPRTETDPEFRGVLTRLCSAPGLASLLGSEDLVRRVVTAVDNVSRGESPASQLPGLAPKGPFRAIRKNGHLVTDPQSYKRYDGLTQTFGSIDMSTCAGAYAQLSPMLEQAYKEVGQPGRTFEQALARAIKRLVTVPIPKAPPELEQHQSYHYTNDQLEGLPQADKLLLRLGPHNMRIVQQKLRELAKALALHDAGG
jgi:hypothetical protein